MRHRTKLVIALVTAGGLVLATAGLSVAVLGQQAEETDGGAATELPAAHTPTDGEAPDEEAPDDAGKGSTRGLPDPSRVGTDVAAEHVARAAAFVEAARAWAACAAEAAAASADDPTFDPHDPCGPNPHPSEFGIPADDGDADRGGRAAGPPEDAPAGPPSTIPPVPVPEVPAAGRS
jgi:hypothetical protein